MTVSTVNIFRREQYKHITIFKVLALTEYIINSMKSCINSINTEDFIVTKQYYQYSSGNPEDFCFVFSLVISCIFPTESPPTPSS